MIKTKKLQIVDYKSLDRLTGDTIHRYSLELDERSITLLPSSVELNTEEVYYKLIDKLTKDFNIEHYPRFIRMPGTIVLLEREVTDTLLKELYTEHRLKEIEEDF